MNVRILCVGKCKEAYLRDAVSEYLKRLSRFAKTEIIEVKDEKTDEEASGHEEALVKDREGERILQKIDRDDYVIALAILGTAFTSEGMARRMQEIMSSGRSTLTFVIGGSLGLSEAVLKRANEQWSFSKLTFPHQLMRVITLEQIYRSFKILSNETYHK